MGSLPRRSKRGSLRNIIKARELWRTRRRLFPSDAEGIRAAHQTLDRVLQLVGRDLACNLFFEAERIYWESRNLAARTQKRRQDSLGLGWGNHDHHTFRSSREHFVDLVAFLLKLGFTKRERYYAGAEAGWGAQVSEQATAGIVVFADVDLMPEETELDFSTRRLPPASRLGTVGLWVGLHGESLLEAGMHHLEARFEFDLLRDQLRGCGVKTMNPFSDFPFLRQAFTEGERWLVRRKRAERLVRAGLITRGQSEQFIRKAPLAAIWRTSNGTAGLRASTRNLSAWSSRPPTPAGTTSVLRLRPPEHDDSIGKTACRSAFLQTEQMVFAGMALRVRASVGSAQACLRNALAGSKAKVNTNRNDFVRIQLQRLEARGLAAPPCQPDPSPLGRRPSRTVSVQDPSSRDSPGDAWVRPLVRRHALSAQRLL